MILRSAFLNITSGRLFLAMNRCTFDPCKGSAGIYIHIPFCHTKCPYCSFVSAAPANDTILKNYLSALLRQIAVMADHPWVSTQSFTSLFIGGGTPSIYGADLLGVLIETCLDTFQFNGRLGRKAFSVPEVTVEVNPNTVTRKKLTALKQTGVNRLSIGMQSFSDKLLKALGRSHSGVDGLKAFEYARTAGFDNLNLDLMYGLPYQNMADWQESLDTAMELAPEHLSIYELMIEEETPFAIRAGKQQLPLPDEDTVIQMESTTEELLLVMGYERYEISNFARPGFQCCHNVNYWENGSYLGLGAGAVSFYSGTRMKNVADPETFIRLVAQGQSTCSETESLSSEAGFRETVIMGLRMISGVSCERLKIRYGLTPLEYYGSTLASLIKQNLIEVCQNHLKLTKKGLPIANQIMAQLV